MRLFTSRSLLLVWLIGCAHGANGGSADDLKKAADEFHRRARWRDLLGASELVVEERKAEFRDARRRGGDDKDLTVTDYELLDVRIATDGLSGSVTSRMQWVRLPSPTEHSAEITSRFVRRGGSWFVLSQDDGPFTDALAPE